jgi:hypothetical protein
VVARIMAGIRLTRETGTAHLVVTHRISDLIGSSQPSRELALGLLADCATRIVYRQAADQIAVRSGCLHIQGSRPVRALRDAQRKTSRPSVSYIALDCPPSTISAGWRIRAQKQSALTWYGDGHGSPNGWRPK